MITERIKFRVFRMPCCGHNLCWVNPRLPSHCPECGGSVFMELKTNPEFTLLLDEEAYLKYHG